MTQKREIKFRGFRIDKNGKGKVFVNGEWVKGYWVEGYYFENANGAFIIQYPYHANYIGVDVLVKIIPETVGQYTGLKDKNGKKIFEGDIVSFIDYTSTESGYSEQQCVGKVIWIDEEACFSVTNRLATESYEVLDECEIINNIYDTPELLEVE